MAPRLGAIFLGLRPWCWPNLTVSDGHFHQATSSKTPAKPRFFEPAMDDLDVPSQLALFAPTRVNRSWIAPRSEKATDCDYHIHRASACPSRAAFHANGTTKTPSKANAASIAHASLTLQTKAAARAEAQHIISTGVYVGAASARVKVSNLRKRFLHRHACTK